MLRSCGVTAIRKYFDFVRFSHTLFALPFALPFALVAMVLATGGILGCTGYGWLRPDGVRRELEKMAAAWHEPPTLLPID
jgi:hypothetical protein